MGSDLSGPGWQRSISSAFSEATSIAYSVGGTKIEQTLHRPPQQVCLMACPAEPQEKHCLHPGPVELSSHRNTPLMYPANLDHGQPVHSQLDVLPFHCYCY
jgi:hypothetical protein